METNKKTELSEYDLSAIEFLKKTNCTIEIEFFDFAKHFEDDKERRFIWNIKLIRGSRSYCFKFGTSIEDVGDHFNKRRSKPNLIVYPAKTIWHQEQIKLETIRLLPKTIKKPSAYSILACLTKYDPCTFENFCSDFGYSEDSRKAEKTYRAVKDEYLNIIALFNDQELSELQEIN